MIETSKMEQKIVLVLVLIFLSTGYAEKTFDLEAEGYIHMPANETIKSITNRETASNKQAVWMLVSQIGMLNFDFCLDKEYDVLGLVT